MLKTLQIVTIIQGVFLIFLLFKNRNKYKKITFRLFIGSLTSILFFIIGDDDNNVFSSGNDWFLFDTSLFITFFFLFFKYMRINQNFFSKKDFWYFLPNIVYILIESIELYQEKPDLIVEAFEKLVEFTFLVYLAFIILDLFKNKSKIWILYLTIPITLHMGLKYFNEMISLLGFKEIILTSSSQYQSYLLLMLAFLFYGITYYFINNPKELIPVDKPKKYKGSNLAEQQISKYKSLINEVIQKKELYKDPKFSIQKLSDELEIPRQYISEILNIHFGKSFQEFVNEYRVNAFVKKLYEEKSNQFTLYGLASQVGFNSKSSFNAIFKKTKGLTPSEFKRKITEK